MISESGHRLRRFARSFARYEERLSPSYWCERYIRLPAGKQEAEHGRVSFATRPYLREPLDCADDPTITDVVLVGPTQGGKTFDLRMVFAWSIAGDPAPTLWVDIDADEARKVSKKNLQPLVEHNACLRSRKPSNRHNYTDLQMLFPAAAFGMTGGQSAQQVAGDTVKRLLCNEVDKWHGKTDKEASIAELARHRTEAYEEERKHFWACTPTLEEMTTWVLHNRGDQRRWFCLCPDCRFAQQLLWDHVYWSPDARISEHKWDLRRVKETSRYRCDNVACGSLWDDRMRLLAVQHSEAHWRATMIGEPGWRSYQFNGLYGPKKSNNCGDLAVDFLSARNTGFYSDRQDFWNSRMGLPWRDDVALLSIGKFAAREKSYLRGTVPDGFKPDLVITGFDVQSNRLPYVVAAFDWSARSFTVDHGAVSSWADLEGIQRDYLKLGGTSYVIGDINYEDRRAETLEQIYLRKDKGWLGAEAFDQAKQLVALEKANVFLGGKLQTEGHYITKLVISAYEFKVELEKRISGEIANWFSYQLPLVADDSEKAEQTEYYKQLLDERRVQRKHRIAGKPALEWKPRTGDNHSFDCWVYMLALFWSLQKQRSYATRKAAAERRVIEVKQ